MAERLPLSYKEFEVKDIPLEECGNMITVSFCSKPHSMEHAVKIADHGCMNVWRVNSNGIVDHCGWIFEDSRGNGTLAVSPDYKSGSFYSDDDADEVLKPLLQAMLECRMIASGVAVLHAACVEAGGKAIAFSGVSGAGKSTRALKWVENLSAVWISGDRPAIDPVKQLAYGVPWDGKEQIFINAAVPIHVVLEVRRAGFTRMRKLTPRQVYNFLVSQLYIPMWDTHLVAKAFLVLKQMTENLRVYRLYCDQTNKAALETYDILFHHPEQIKEAIEEMNDMRLKSGFEIVEVAGDYMAIPTGDKMVTFGGAVVLNEVSAFLLRALKQPVTREELLELLLEEYDVERELASADLDLILEKFAQMGLIE